MSENPATRFITRWRPLLERGARLHFNAAPRAGLEGNHCQLADQFMRSLGLSEIGFNWELLDAAGASDEPRSALGQIIKALSEDLSNPSQPWLAREQAQACASEFLALFDQAGATVVSNRYDGLWNPLAGGGVEWGFVGFDAQQIAMLLLVAD